jgi:5-methylcytosine-specific restriction endonuclease McrA
MSTAWEHMPTPRRRALLAALIVRDGPGCQLCGIPIARRPSIDHRLPSRDYPHLLFSMSNMQVACLSCNCAKGARLRPTPNGLGNVSQRWAGLMSEATP